MKWATFLVVAGTSLFLLSGCGAKKVVARNCEKAGNADLYVCEKY